MRIEAKSPSATCQARKAGPGSFEQRAAASSAQNSGYPSSRRRQWSCVDLDLRENIHEIAVALVRTILGRAQISCAGAHANCAGGIIRQALNLFRQLVNFAGIEEQARLPVFHDVGQAAHARGNYRLRCHEGFENSDREIFVPLRRHNQAERVSQKLPFLVATLEAEELNVADPLLADVILQFLLQRPGSENLQRNLRQLLEGVNQRPAALLRR